jgi:hypothetical protein
LGILERHPTMAERQHTVAIDPVIPSKIYAGKGAASSIPLFKSADLTWFKF